MFYALNENVYLVAGKVRGCIYDFNHSKLYSLNESLTQKIKLINADDDGKTRNAFYR